MIIKTVKWNKRLCVSILIGLGVVLIAVVLLAGAIGRGGSNTGRAASNEDRVRYLAELGWEVGADPLEEKEVLIPQKFSGVFEEYNKLQKQQGFDLSHYAGKTATLYSYQVMNYPSPDTGAGGPVHRWQPRGGGRHTFHRPRRFHARAHPTEELTCGQPEKASGYTAGSLFSWQVSPA